MSETTPAVKLRASVVQLVVRSIVGLTFLLYATIGVLLLVATIRRMPLDDAVPSELWAAASAGFGYLTATLVNTKHDATAQDPAPVQVMNAPTDPVPTDPVAADEPPVEGPPVEDDVPAEGDDISAVRRTRKR